MESLNTLLQNAKSNIDEANKNISLFKVPCQKSDKLIRIEVNEKSDKLIRIEVNDYKEEEEEEEEEEVNTHEDIILEQ